MGRAVFRGDVAGDPSGWARALTDIDSVRDATRSRGAHIVLAVVSEAPLGDVPEDRALSLIRQAGVERRWGVAAAITNTPTRDACGRCAARCFLLTASPSSCSCDTGPRLCCSLASS